LNPCPAAVLVVVCIVCFILFVPVDLIFGAPDAPQPNGSLVSGCCIP
jgi:energy-converting hydrogenase Eha subunit B